MDRENFEITTILKLAWSGKLWIISFISIAFIISFLYALSLPNKYTSSVLIVPFEDSSASSNLSKYSGLANLAGLSIPAESDKAAIGLEILKSRRFVENFIHKNELLPVLMASKDWNAETGKIIFNSKKYDPLSEKWVREVKFPKKAKPSIHEAYDFWIKNIFSMSEDQQTGFITFNIEHHSPVIAEKWANMLINDLNNFIRESNVEEASKSIEYLEYESINTNFDELRSLLYSLIQTEIEKKMLAYARSEYLFKVIDPAIISEDKSSPSRVLIIILGSLLGAMLGLLFVLIRISLTKNFN